MAQEDSCFFDICLPNYTEDSQRRITYFNEISEHVGCDHHHDICHVKDEAMRSETKRQAPVQSHKGRTLLEYMTTTPNLPKGMEVTELSYRGDFEDAKTTHVSNSNELKNPDKFLRG